MAVSSVLAAACKRMSWYARAHTFQSASGASKEYLLAISSLHVTACLELLAIYITFNRLRSVAVLRCAYLNRGLTNKDLLEAPLEGCIFLHVLPVLSKCCCSNAPQLPSGKHWLQQIGCMTNTLLLALAISLTLDKEKLLPNLHLEDLHCIVTALHAWSSQARRHTPGHQGHVGSKACHGSIVMVHTCIHGTI